MSDNCAEKYSYQIEKIMFMVEPVYRDEGETLAAILLKLMQADAERL